MNGLEPQIALLDATVGVVQFAVNWLLQSTLLLAAGLIAAGILRQRGSAIESAVCRTTLAAVLVCPLVSWGLWWAGVSGWAVELPDGWAYQTIEPPLGDVETPASMRPIGADAVTSSIDFTEPIQWEPDAATSPGTFPEVTSTEIMTGVVQASQAPVVVPEPLIERPVDTSKAEQFTIHRLGWVALTLAAAWLLGSVLLGARLAGAWWRLARLRRGSVHAESEVMHKCREIASLLNVFTPDVLRSPYLTSPCLMGLRQPAVLLPAGEFSLSVRDVLIHELAHLKRRDCHWNLLRHAAAAVFFFQPLLWSLSRRMERTAEEVCDDYVIQYGGNRQDYAHRLVDVAELNYAPVPAVGVGVVSLKSVLARRVTRIMDTSRPLSTRVGSFLLAVVLAGGAVGTAIVGLVGLAPQPSHAETQADIGESNPIRTAGESKELGDMRLADESELVAAAKQAVQELPVTQTPPRAVMSGRITLPGKQPVADAHVAVIAMRSQAARGGDLSPTGEVLAEATTDGSGDYRLVIQGASSKTHHHAQVIARKDGSAIAWAPLDLDAANSEASRELPPEAPIRGRLVDIEGQPAAGVQLVVRAVMKRSSDGELMSEGVGYRGELIPAAWLPGVKTDEQGRFTVNGIPDGHGVFLHVIGNDRFAPQDIALNTGMPEQRGARDGTYRPLVKNTAPGEEAVLPLAPAQIFEGVVTFEDTGQPAPHARLTIWASQEELGSMVSVAGKADREGRYRINPKPGIRFGITAYPPDGTPYLTRRTPSSSAIRWEAGDHVKRVDMTLPRGVLVRGKVLESGTAAPVAGASIQYVPERANNPHTADDILTGWQDTQLSDEHGQFEIVLLPGPGRLLVHGPPGKYVLQEIAGRQLDAGKPGGRRYYVHAVQEIDPEKGAEPIDVTLLLQPGISVRGRVVDQQGQSVDEVFIISRLTFSPLSLWWRGQMPPTLGGRFELWGLEEGKDYPVYFLDAKRHLGRTAMVRADSDEQTVVLEPCGTALARFVDREGNPHVGFQPDLEMIVTPGAHQYDRAASERGELAADVDFVANIDARNYWSGPETDEQGKVTFPALIPGATYRLSTFEDGNPVLLKQFTVAPGEQLELGDVTIDSDN